MLIRKELKAYTNSKPAQVTLAWPVQFLLFLIALLAVLSGVGLGYLFL